MNCNHTVNCDHTVNFNHTVTTSPTMQCSELWNDAVDVIAGEIIDYRCSAVNCGMMRLT